MDVDEGSGDEASPVATTRTHKRSPQKPQKVMQLNWNDTSDGEGEEEEPTQAHHPECEKCHMLSATQLWDILHAPRRKRKKDELSDHEVQELGSWVECSQCTVA